eukprot:TRINITY_DN14912_c0_g1_i2.p1 TRINITY_DN14912_c0_g1~~TRINITY_DN14912_c0_g1_i2.p1  ORF type:complete len:126 (+),score=34.58 TRINITY_DN14912_c0_g1_i2:62-439(+)
MSSLSSSFTVFLFFFFLMIRRPPRSTLSSSSAASDVYKRQVCRHAFVLSEELVDSRVAGAGMLDVLELVNGPTIPPGVQVHEKTECAENVTVPTSHTTQQRVLEPMTTSDSVSCLLYTSPSPRDS